MSRLLEKARQALLTDPVTGEPINPATVAVWTFFATFIVMTMLMLSLGLGGGQ